MKRKLTKYLSSKDKTCYTKLDFVLEVFQNGALKKYLLKFNFYDVEIIPSCKKDKWDLEISFCYFNFACTISLYENEYEYVVYPKGIDVYGYENNIIQKEYDENFSIVQLIDSVEEAIRNNPDKKILNDTNIKKKKIYKILSILFICLPILISGAIAIFGWITGIEIKGGLGWVVPLWIISYAVGFTLEYKSIK